MQGKGSLAPHEALYLHELLMSKSTCVEKLIAMRPMIQDQQLAQLADQSITSTKKEMQEIQGLLSSTGMVTLL
ncbi:MAG: hypothetical protein WBI55_08290 [Eubacteriales bacterium]|jgi:hypothetical protein|nr:spore coat protein [Clostridiales bacterium]